MRDREGWQHLIAGSGLAPALVRAESFDHAYTSYSQPRRVKCSDGHYYVIKGPNAGKTMVNEQLVGRLGGAMGAPVGEVAFIDVSRALIDAEPRMAPITAGIVHGSRFMRDVSNDRQNLAPIELDINRGRFALLAMLYGWVGASDHQVLYQELSPRFVFSVDHGHFFPNGPDWTADGLNCAAGATPDAVVVAQCGLVRDDLVPAAAAMAAVTEARIAEIISWIPADWPFLETERVVMALYLDRRRRELLAAFPEVRQEATP